MRFLSLLLLLCLFIVGLAADVPPFISAGDQAYIPGELVAYVPNRPGIDAEDPSSLLETWGYSRTSQEVVFNNLTLRLYKASERGVAKSVGEAILLFNGSLTRKNGVKLLPNYIFRINETSDPLFGRKDTFKDRDGNPHDILLQWDMKNPGEFKGIPDADLHVVEAWKLLAKNDEPIIVAVVDTGVDVEHPALQDRIYKKNGEVVGADFTRLFDGDYMDDHGHGSHCAGSIAARYDDDEGTTGSSGPANIKIIPIKALDKSGAGNLISITLAMKWAGEQGADIMSMSFGAVPLFPEQEPILKEVFDEVFDSAELANTISIGAAGNNGKDIHAFPAFCAKVIAIAASDNQDQLASFSNFGNWVDVASPGVNIVSVRPQYKGRYLDMYRDAGFDKAEFAIGNDPNEAYDTRRYYIASGTSMACPNAAGVVALLLAANPNLKANPDEIRTILMETSDKKGTFKIKAEGGRINAHEAMKAALNR